MVCPNINTTEWRLLEAQVGSKEAYRVFAANNNNIPDPKQPARIKKDIGFKEVVPYKKDVQALENTMVHYNMENNTSHFIESNQVARGHKLDIVLNYLPFGVFEQMKIDAGNAEFIGTKEIKGAKAAQLNVSFEVNPINFDTIFDNANKQKDLIVDAAIPPMQRPKELYALDTQDTAVADKQLTEKLTQILYKNGVQVHSGIENLKTRKRMDAAAITDLINNLILVAKGTREAEVLPEEAAHFVIGTMATDSPIYQKLSKLIEKSPEYAEVVEKYSQEYNGDIDALKEEAMGKVLAKQIVKVDAAQTVQTTDAQLIRLIKGLWARVKRALGRIVYKNYQAELEQILGKTAEGFLNEQSKIDTSDQTSTRQRHFYSLTGSMTEVGKKDPKKVEQTEGHENEPGIDTRQNVEFNNKKTITEIIEQDRAPLTEEDKIRIEAELKILVGNMVGELDKRRKIIKSTSSRSKGELDFERKRIELLEGHLEELAFLAGVEQYLSTGMEDLIGKKTVRKGKFSNLPETINYAGALQALEDLEFQFREGTIQNINEAARELRDINGFIVSYKKNLEAISNSIKDLKLYDQDDIYIPKIEALLQEVTTKVLQVEAKYYDIGSELFAQFLGGYMGDRNQSKRLDKLDIKAALKQADRDINFFHLWANAMAESGDDILKLMESAVKSAKYTAQIDALNDQKDMLAAQEKLAKAGYKNTSFVAERDPKGKITGNMLSQNGVNYQKFYDANKEFQESLGPYPKRDDFNTDSAFTTALSERTAAIDKWYIENTEIVPNVQQLKESKKQELSSFNYSIWFDMNIDQSNIEGEVVRNKSELRMPKKSKYADPAYSELAPAQKEFLDVVWDVKRRTDNKMNPKFVRPNQMPMIRKDMVETIKGAKTAKDALRGLNRIKEHFVRTEDDTDYGGQAVVAEEEEGDNIKRDPYEKNVFTDVRGRIVRFLPVFFTKRLRNMDDLSLDIVATMSAQSAMSNDYYQMEKIIHILEIGKDYILDKREVPINVKWFESLTGQKDAEGNKIKKKAMQAPGASNIAERLRGYFDMQVYGNYKADEGQVGGVDVAKVVDAVGSYVAINNLGLNIYAGFANVIFGTSNIRIEAAAGRFFDHKNLVYGDKTYTRDLSAMLGEIGLKNKKSKLALWTEKFDTLQDFEQEVASINTTRGTRLSNLATMSSIFFLNHMGEHYMQTRTSLAMADRIKLKDKDGNEVSLYDAFHVVGNKLVLKSEFEGQFTDEDLVKFRKRQNGVNQSLHGVYNKLDKSYMQQRSYLRLVLMFRKFVIPGINRRYGKLQYNYATDATTEGYYRAAGRFMAQLSKDIIAGQFSIMKNWNVLTEHEKQNFMRTFYEVAYMLAFLTLGTILIGLSDDDEDNWTLNMAAYQAHRVYTEFAAYIPVPGLGFSEALRMVKSPAAAVSVMAQLNNTLISLWNPTEEMKSGQYKGWKKWQRYGVDLVPLHRTVKGWMTPEEKIKFFTQPVY